jgi:hypothetical protein
VLPAFIAVLPLQAAASCNEPPATTTPSLTELLLKLTQSSPHVIPQSHEIKTR